LKCKALDGKKNTVTIAGKNPIFQGGGERNWYQKSRRDTCGSRGREHLETSPECGLDLNATKVEERRKIQLHAAWASIKRASAGQKGGNPESILMKNKLRRSGSRSAAPLIAGAKLRDKGHILGRGKGELSECFCCKEERKRLRIEGNIKKGRNKKKTVARQGCNLLCRFPK